MREKEENFPNILFGLVFSDRYFYDRCFSVGAPFTCGSDRNGLFDFLCV
ncbi:hypothetical protein LEP1GSC150_2447 [Leptospira interrogans serovar Copenhageni str. LT2050]|uniref:Uncharacterized protein n=2 Tax=Leptospira interrogans TaxID=173 RepID=M6HIZ4_LEPIR|nr:hypothetical protein LEP1GSC150_2447 [Leptospira interrogans serovar Copenhageni str. LT2050]EMM97323.1 hypothetical protein LEP1GSC158_2585 [Leptospira interrogans serovar Zanoni str. LT2156]